MGDSPGIVGKPVVLLQSDGLAEFLNGPLQLTKVPVRQPPVVVCVGLAGLQFQGPAEVLHCQERLSHFAVG